MKLSIVKPIAAALAMALAIPLAFAIASTTSASVTASTWTVSSGPTLGTTPFPSGGTHASVSWTGKIDPALGTGEGGNISSIKVVCTSGADEVIAATDFAGAAQGSSFTIYIKQSALQGNCSKQLKVTYQLSNGQESVTVYSPATLNTAVIDYGQLVYLPSYEVQFTVKVVNHLGAVNESYNGEALIVAQSREGGVKLNGTWGTAVVPIADGLGSLAVDASTVPSGALVIFDLSAERTDPYRTSIEVQ